MKPSFEGWLKERIYRAIETAYDAGEMPSGVRKVDCQSIGSLVSDIAHKELTAMTVEQFVEMKDSASQDAMQNRRAE